MFKIKVIDHADKHPEFSCKNDQSILDAANIQGVRIPYACKGGGCGMCKIKVEAGHYERGKSSKAVLPDSERELNYTLACKTYPKSDLKVLVLPI